MGLRVFLRDAKPLDSIATRLEGPMRKLGGAARSCAAQLQGTAR